LRIGRKAVNEIDQPYTGVDPTLELFPKGITKIKTITTYHEKPALIFDKVKNKCQLDLRGKTRNTIIESGHREIGLKNKKELCRWGGD
jgi:hypothetical protein